MRTHNIEMKLLRNNNYALAALLSQLKSAYIVDRSVKPKETDWRHGFSTGTLFRSQGALNSLYKYIRSSKILWNSQLR